MNTEKIEKLKKSLSNSKIPADLKPKIEAEIKRLEDLDAKQSEPKVEPKEEEKEVKPVAKKTTTRKPRATKSVAKKTSTRKPSQTSKPKRTAMSVAKEIRKDGESWKDAMARASKVMKEKSKTATKDVETELEKLTKLVRGEKNKEKVSRVSDTNLKRDASRKAKPLGARKVTRSGETSNQYGTYKNHLGRKYVENRDKHGDRLAPRYPKNAPLLAEGGYLTDPNFGNFQTGVFAEGGALYSAYTNNPLKYLSLMGAKTYGDLNYSTEHNGIDYYVGRKKDKNGNNVAIVVAFIDDENKYMIEREDAKEMSETAREKGVDIVELYTNYGVELHTTQKPQVLGFDKIYKVRGNYAKGGGVRKVGNREYSYGRNWTNDHKHTNKGEEHEVSYTRKKLAKGGRVESLTKELYRLQRELNSSRLQTYRLGDNSQEAKDRKKEREVKLARFNEVLKELRESDAKFESGGGIPNNYEGKTPEEVWNMWTEKQKQHFLVDHFNHFIVEEFKGKNLIDISRLEYKKLPLRVRLELDFHVNKGQYAKGGGIRRKNGQTYDYGRVWTKDHNEFDKGSDHEVEYRRKKRFELGGNVVTDLAGHTGGSLGTVDPSMLDGFSNTAYTGLVGETGAMSSGEMFANGGSVNSKFDLSGYKKFRTFNDLEEAKEYVDMDRKKYSRAKESVVIKEGNKFQVWVIPATGIETGERVYELGGGLPSGAEQSYMITESLGNPAQHFAKGGGVRKVGNREYSYGRNWTNDHRHVNQDEEHEVKYTRKGKFLGIFAGGGETYSEKASQLKGGVDYYSVDIDLDNGDEIRDLTFKSLDKAKKEFLKYSNSMVYDGENIDDIQLIVSFKNGDYENIYLNKGGAVTNERKHVNHDEDYEVRYAKPRPHRKGYKGVRKFMAGGSMETPKIYVADLEAYNNGRLSGVWLDFADYNDADELMEAIQDFLKTTGGEEYAIHDVENIPNSMYSEYMGQKDFEELYEMMDLAKQNDLPLSVVQEVVSQYDASAVDEFYGKYDDAEDFAQSLVDEMGIESFNDFEYYLEVSDTDRRLLAQEMADSYVDDIRDEDGGNRLIEEAGLDVDEYEEADSDRQEEMLDEAREIVYDEYYDTWYEGLSDPYSYLVEEQGFYSAEDFAKADFVRIDFEKLGDALEQDYTFIYEDGSLYVFNIR